MNSLRVRGREIGGERRRGKAKGVRGRQREKGRRRRRTEGRERESR
jgi:hypothetical protein